MQTCEAIDIFRLEKFLGKREQISASDIFAYLVRVSQSTLFQSYRTSRKPVESEMISAAAKYFFTFYQRESVLDFDPRSVLIGCMNLAAKTEEYHAISLSDLVNALPDAAQLKAGIPRIEMKILAAMEYDLVVEQPWLIMLYWVDHIKGPEDGDGIHLRVYDMACDIMRIWQWTDAVLIFPFPQLATAAVYKACLQVATTSPEGESMDSAVARMTAAVDSTVKGLDVEQLLVKIEVVVSRFGPFEKVLKDPSYERSAGYRELVDLHRN